MLRYKENIHKTPKCACFPERPLDARRPEGVHEVVREAERHHLGDLELVALKNVRLSDFQITEKEIKPNVHKNLNFFKILFNLVEEAVHVDVDGVAVAGVVHDVLGVPVAQADDVADLNRISERVRAKSTDHQAPKL